MCMRYNFWMCQSLTSMCQTWESGRDQFWHGMHQGEESPLASLQVIPNNWSCNAGVRASYNPTLIALEKVRRWVMHGICQSNRRLIIHKHRLWILFSLFWYLASVGRPPWALVGTERAWGEKEWLTAWLISSAWGGDQGEQRSLFLTRHQTRAAYSSPALIIQAAGVIRAAGLLRQL